MTQVNRCDGDFPTNGVRGHRGDVVGLTCQALVFVEASPQTVEVESKESILCFGSKTLRFDFDENRLSRLCVENEINSVMVSERAALYHGTRGARAKLFLHVVGHLDAFFDPVVVVRLLATFANGVRHVWVGFAQSVRFG